MAKLTKHQRLFLTEILHGRSVAQHAANKSGRTFTLASLEKRGLIKSKGPSVNGWDLTEAGHVAIGAPVTGTRRYHYARTNGTSRLCGAPKEEWSTAEVAEVTCEACKAKIEVARVLNTISASADAALAAIEARPAVPVEPEHGTLPPEGFKSWRPMVIADGSGTWAGNALRFATKEEAEANVRDLSWRWMLVRETKVEPSTDEANYQWDVERGLVPCRKEG
jgi:hypothetical protein